MKFLNSTNTLTLRYLPKHIISPVALRYLASPINPIRFKIKHLYDNRDRNILWWKVSTQHLTQHKRVIRSWCARRVRLAFRCALKERGFDAEGRRRGPNIDESAGISKGENVNLVGSVDIFIRPRCVHEDYPTLQAEMNTLVDSFIQNINEGNRAKSPQDQAAEASK